MWRQVNGTRLFFRMFGAAPSSDNIVVLHHGYTASSLTWEPCAAALSAIDPSLCIVVPDCRGAGVHGSGAGSKDEHFTIAQLADDAISVVDVLQGEAEAGIKISDPKVAVCRGNLRSVGIRWVVWLVHKSRWHPRKECVRSF